MSQWHQCSVDGNYIHIQIGRLINHFHPCSHYTFLKSPEDEDKQSGMHIPYCRLMEVIGWFFFDLLILGYVEDMDTGLSFHLLGGPGWHVYVEVPSRDINMTCDETLEQFFGDIPTLGLLGSPHLVSNDAPYIIDKEVQLVCKYLKAYKEKRIDELYNNIRGMSSCLTACIDTVSSHTS